MATKRCKKYGVVKSGPRKGMCRKHPAPKKKGAKKSTRRGNCVKFGRNERTGMCRKAPARGDVARVRAVEWGRKFSQANSPY